ncbi:unnamed protein product [Trypanosoma congolense IL3000]|uniref:WGS project CAEQ00000000 data, annotated contig 159 n=1 Tax=Trypanosoma congolense (strain IL3000) TaxID=1068625 RepID=F9W7B9_TRYCI|nr:unnamed protein product [Trypanosoma congolense IL3000]
MIMKTVSVWWIIAWGLMFRSEVSSASSRRKQAIPIEAGESICSLSKTLKDVPPWTQEKIADLRKTRDAYASKLLDWQLYFHGSSECGVNESIFGEIWVTLEAVDEEIKTLPTKAIRAGAFAAKSAGRLDEFITVFANAKKESFIDGVNYCLGGGGNPAKRRDLLDCFPEGEKLEIGEANIGKIPESMTNIKELNLTAALRNVNHSAVGSYFNRIHWIDLHAGCNLVKGASGGILGNVNLESPLWWGGGILTIGKNFDGNLSKVKDTKDIESDDNGATWTASPTTIPHLQKSLDAFQDFKDTAARITKKISEIEKIEKQIEPCLSNETTEEGPTQSCFKNAVRLNAELQAANALLARYHKEKGPLPSGSTLILNQSVVSAWCLIAFLL